MPTALTSQALTLRGTRPLRAAVSMLKRAVDQAFRLTPLTSLDCLRSNAGGRPVQKTLPSRSEPPGPFGPHSEKCARLRQLLHLGPGHGAHHLQGMTAALDIKCIIIY